jgi:hypothetical protein
MTDGVDALTAEVVSGCFSSAASQELRQTLAEIISRLRQEFDLAE